MKRTYKIVIAAVLLLVCGLLAWKLFFSKPKPEEPVTPPEDETSEATIQEDNGDIIITIPDDQESAGE